MARIDNQIKTLDCEVIFGMEGLRVNLLSDRTDKALPPCTNLLELKFENPQLRLFKRGIECGFAGFGLSLSTLNSFEMLFHFVR